MKYPFIFQKNSNDCGPTCIFMLCEYYRIPYNPNEILNLSNLSSKGTSIWNMQIILQSLGFSCQAKYLYNFLNYNYSFPIIALIKTSNNLFHYVIIYKKYKLSLYVADPAFGIKVISTRDFLLNFTYMTIIPKFNK